ncbi:MAG: hypothetical protein PVG24_10255 [Gammaproteobacteria bacterium]|jgi:hypothetical protein
MAIVNAVDNAMLKNGVCRLCWPALGAALLAGSAAAQDAGDDPLANYEPPLGALAPENLNAERPAAPFDLTGTWFVDLDATPSSWRFGPPYPEFTQAAQVHIDASRAAAEEGKVYRDDIGQCWPAGLPLIMTRVWPISMIQLPTAIYMISGFMNSLRIVYLDGREHTPADIVVRSFNGESIGHWEGDTLVVDTRHFVDHHHWMDQGGISIPAGDQLRIIERIQLNEETDQLEIEYTMTDPEHWIGEWKHTKYFNRVNDVDIEEVSCRPDLNENMLSTSSDSLVD